MKTVRCAASALVIRSLPLADKGTDTNKRMIKGQIAVNYGVSHDAGWLYVDAPAGRGWVSEKFVEAVAATDLLPTPSWPSAPKGLTGIKEMFGEPGKPICQAGRVNLPGVLTLSWEMANIKVFACHKLVEDVFTSAFQTISDRGLWALLEDFGGCYEFRAVRAGSKISTHAWGISVDINTKGNPLGQKPKMDPRIIAIFRDHGFTWGGEWERPDGMHFQYATGY